MVTVKHKDANCVLSCNASPKKRFDIIDVDPFGTPAPYLDSALRAIRNNGLLASTATDLAPLCGVHAKACIRKYGGRPLRTEYCHELAVRLLAGCTAILAAKHDIGIQVVFSHSSEHYIRLYAQIAYGAKKADESVKSTWVHFALFQLFSPRNHHTNRSATCNALNAAQKWIMRVHYGWETSSTQTSLNQ